MEEYVNLLRPLALPEEDELLLLELCLFSGLFDTERSSMLFTDLFIEPEDTEDRTDVSPSAPMLGMSVLLLTATRFPPLGLGLVLGS